MAKEWINEFSGVHRGSVETNSDGTKVYKDFTGRITAKYDPRENATRDFYGRKISSGDTGSSTLDTWEK